MPEQWNLQALFAVSSVMAGVALISSIVLLYCMLDSWQPDSLFQKWNLGGVSYGQITTAIYLKVSVSDFLTLFSARTGANWFWTSRPATILMYAACFALSISTILAISWPPSAPDGVPTSGLGRRTPYGLFAYIWIYCLFWWFIQDAAKVYLYKIIERYNLFGFNETGKVDLPPSTLKYIEVHKQADMDAAKSCGGH
jgi:H+-transporting ATPase